MSAGSWTDPVSAALQRYADRGVFRGFRAAPGAGGRVEYQFLWLLRRPMHAVFDPRHRTLAFPLLFPDARATPGLVAALNAVVASRSRRNQPTHKRIDGRRTSLTAAVRKGHWSLTAGVRGDNHEYAVRMTLNLINELFVMLHESHPEYLVEHFGMSTE